MPVRAQKLDEGVVIGQGARLWSQTLGEERRILVWLPERYSEARRAYPVLYLLDAEEHFLHLVGIVQFLASNGRIPPMMVIGITNTNRDRDLTPPTQIAEEQAENPAAGGAKNFLRFAVDELIPWVDSHYRTVPFRILAGHSLGGLMNVYALLTRPQAFQAHIAASPSLWWDGEGYLSRAQQEFPQLASTHFLYLTCGDREAVISAPAEKLAAFLRERPVPGLRFRFRKYEGHDHSLTPHHSFYDGLEHIYAGWDLDFDPHDEKAFPSLDDVKAHYSALSSLYGYPITPPPEAIDFVAEQMLAHDNHPAALPLLERNVVDYPECAEAHEDLGRALEAAGRYDDALRAYRRALTLVLEGEHTYGDPLGDFRRHEEEIARKQPGR